MRLSSYNLFVRDGDHTVAVNLLSRAAVKLSPASYRRLLRWSGDGLPTDLGDDERTFAEFMVQSRFLIDDDFHEIGFIRERTRRERFHSRALGLVIAPTMGCNFSCHYCFEDKAEVFLDAASQARILELVAERTGSFDALEVQWFGGEPLRGLDVVESLSSGFCALAAEHGFSYSALLISNGYLLTADVAGRLCALGVRSLQVTLDGDRALHDRTRREPGGHGSFDRILANLRAVPDEVEVGVRVHLAPFNHTDVLRLLDTLDAAGMQQHIDRLYCAPLFNYRAGMTSPAYQPDGKRFASSAEFAALQVSVLEKAHALGFRLDDFLDVSYGICTAVRGDTLLVDAQGHLLKCYKDCGVAEEAFGDLAGGVDRPENLRKWVDVDIPRDEECRACTFLPVCFGGCAKQWQEGADKSVICTPLKYNYEERLRLLFRDTDLCPPRAPAAAGSAKPVLQLGTR